MRKEPGTEVTMRMRLPGDLKESLEGRQMFLTRTGHGTGIGVNFYLHLTRPGFLGQHLVYTYMIRTLMGFPGSKL